MCQFWSIYNIFNTSRRNASTAPTSVFTKLGLLRAFPLKVALSSTTILSFLTPTSGYALPKTIWTDVPKVAFFSTTVAGSPLTALNLSMKQQAMGSFLPLFSASKAKLSPIIYPPLLTTLKMVRTALLSPPPPAPQSTCSTFPLDPTEV